MSHLLARHFERVGVIIAVHGAGVKRIGCAHALNLLDLSTRNSDRV